jgi:hypothetical protein
VKVLLKMVCYTCRLTLILLTWKIWQAPNNASKWQMRFNLAFKGLTTLGTRYCSFSPLCCFPILFCFNLYGGGFILFCNVCVCLCGFCNVCVCVGFVTCGCFGNMYTVL